MIQKLHKIQKELKAPKGQYNEFGNFKYRSCEDILEAIKPLLEDCLLTLSDELVQVGDRYYIKATAELRDKENKLFVTAYAREAENKKGMDASQITGSTSSYARKYALNGMFVIYDTRDADTMDNTKKDKGTPKKQPSGRSSGEMSKKQSEAILKIGKSFELTEPETTAISGESDPEADIAD